MRLHWRKGQEPEQALQLLKELDPHQQPYTGQHQHGSAGPRDRLGNRGSPPPQQHHSRRIGAGQPARPQGYRSRVDGHNRSLVDPDSAYDWDLEEQWEDEEEQ